MKTTKLIKWGALVLLLSLGLFALGFLVLRANSQAQTINDLETILTKKGMIVQSITTIKQIPFVIKITIQSKSEDKNWRPEDIYYAQIARKGATLFYRHGQRIIGYELEMVNARGERIGWESHNIIPNEFSQQSSLPPTSSLSDQDTAKIVQSEFDFHGLVIENFVVATDLFLGDSGQEITLVLSTADIETANRDLIPFLLSVRSTLDDINSTYGTKISLVWIRAYDQKGALLLNYVWDVETRQETSLQAPGIEPWYPHPPPDIETTGTPSAISSGTPATVVPSVEVTRSYPPPALLESTPTLPVYP